MKRPNYGDNDYVGNGIIICEGCGNPVRDHSLLSPCPALEGDRITVARPSRRFDRRGESIESERRRRYPR